VDAESLGQLVDGGSCLVAGHQFNDLGWSQPSMNLLFGLNIGSREPIWDHFYKVLKTLSLVTMV
jgi:hypothetical protein